MFHQWLPDFFVDDHVTDGADYQYDVTFTIDDGPNVYGPTARWIDDVVVVTYSSVNSNSFEKYGECVMGQKATLVVEEEQSIMLYPERNPNVAPADARLAMVRAAVAGVAGLEVTSIEIDRAGPTYTIDTVEAYARDGRELFLGRAGRLLGHDGCLSPVSFRVERCTCRLVPRAALRWVGN